MNNNLSLMVSGGLDSVIAYHYAIKHNYNPIPIFVNLGHPYVHKEIQSIDNLENNLNIKVNRINLSDLYPLIQHRLTNQIIPSRNLLLSVIGAMFSERVWISALKGEELGKEHDKSHRFFEDSTNLLTFLNNFFQKETIVETPFKTMSKADTIKWALNNGISLDTLLKTTSCYSGESQKCGKCLTCFKRWAAFKLNDIEEPGYEQHPLKGEYFLELMVGIANADYNKDYSRFTEDRINEFRTLLTKIDINT